MKRSVPRHRLTRRKRRMVSIALAASTIGLSTIGVLAISGEIAAAATDTVTTCNGAGPGSLSATVTSAGAGDTINFSVTCPSTSPIVLAAPINIATNLTIEGPGASRLAVSGNSSVGVFNVGTGVTATISGLTIENGFATGGGGVWNSGNLTVMSSTISNNTSTFQGGAGILSIGTLTVRNSLVADNTTRAGGGDGGGIFNGYTHSATIEDSTVSGNSASEGGGIDNDSGELSVYDSTVSNNGASLGGGIWNDNGNPSITSGLTVQNSTLFGNAATIEGGGIFNLSGLANVTGTTASDNTAQTGGGGGIYNSGEAATTNLSSSILANSSSGGDCSGTAEDIGYNLADDDTCGLTSSTSLSDVPAGLDASGLKSNGGPTQTVALEPGSAAIGAVEKCIPVFDP